MKKYVLLLLAMVSCSKDMEEILPIPTVNQNTSNIITTPLRINHKYTERILLAMDISVNSAPDFIDPSGNEVILLAPSPARWPLAETLPLPVISLVKKSNVWSIEEYFDNINMGMGGRDIFEFGPGGFLWADTGPEIIDAPDPMNHLYISKTNNGKTSWTQVSTYKSFYHGGSAGDLNNDGLLDVVGINLTPSENPDGERIHTYIQNLDGSFTQRKIIDKTIASYTCPPGEENCPGFAGSSVLVHDIDNDGFPEIIKGSSIRFQTDIVRNSLEIYSDKDKDGIYSMLTSVPEMSYWLNSNISSSQIKPYDYDMDGDDDLFIFFEDTATEQDFGLGILNNIGEGKFEDSGIRIDRPINELLAREFELIDFDNDGDLDIMFNLLANWRGTGDIVMDVNNNTLDLSNLIWENDNGVFHKTNKLGKLPLPSVKSLKFLKAAKVGNRVKFFGIQCLEPYSNGYINLVEIYL